MDWTKAGAGLFGCGLLVCGVFGVADMVRCVCWLTGGGGALRARVRVRVRERGLYRCENSAREAR